jgi:hypothetical protein
MHRHDAHLPRHKKLVEDVACFKEGARQNFLRNNSRRYGNSSSIVSFGLADSLGALTFSQALLMFSVYFVNENLARFLPSLVEHVVSAHAGPFLNFKRRIHGKE